MDIRNLDELQAEYDRLVARRAQAIARYDKSEDGSHAKHRNKLPPTEGR